MTESPPDVPGRPRNAAVTRAGILTAARPLFARRGFEGVGVRDVAAEAGVNAALVIRYFGSKEGLFAEAVSAEFSLEGLLEGDRAHLGERLARAVLQKDEEAGALEPLLALLRSATAEPAASLLRAALNRGFVRPLAGWLGGPEAEVRAGLIAACLMGLTVNRFVVREGVLASRDPAALIRQTAPMLQQLVDVGVP